MISGNSETELEVVSIPKAYMLLAAPALSEMDKTVKITAE